MAYGNYRNMSAQAAAYWSRPYAVKIATDDFSGTFMFETEHEAVAYIAAQSNTFKPRHGRYSHFSAILSMDGRSRQWILQDIIDLGLLRR